MIALRLANWVVLGLAAFIMIAAAGVAWYLFSGRYSVAATEPHPPMVEEAIHDIYHASVSRHSADIEVPTLDRARAAEGSTLYAAECAMCHALPGEDRQRWAEGLYPLPPHLPDDGSHLEIEETFWVIRHGIKLTGMPAYEHTLSDEEIWSVTAFVDRLHGMTLEEYQELLALEAAGNGGSAPDEAPPDDEAAEEGNGA